MEEKEVKPKRYKKPQPKPAEIKADKQAKLALMKFEGRLTNDEICKELDISLRTLKRYMGRPAFREAYAELDETYDRKFVGETRDLLDVALARARELLEDPQLAKRSAHTLFEFTKMLSDIYIALRKEDEEVKDERAELKTLLKLAKDSADRRAIETKWRVLPPGTTLTEPDSSARTKETEEASG